MADLRVDDVGAPHGVGPSAGPMMVPGPTPGGGGAAGEGEPVACTITSS